MNHNHIKQFWIVVILLATVVFAFAATTVKISDLPIITSPSTNTFIEVADMNAATKSRKYLLTNLATVASSDAGFVLRSGDTMTGTLTVTGLTNSALTASRVVLSAADKSLSSAATTQIITGTGAAAGASDVTTALGYTPVNKAGDAVTGGLTANGVISVKAPPYNAVGDGVTDDTTAVTQALTNAVVYFPPGTYLVNGPLYPTNGVVFGAGLNSSKIKLRNPGSVALFDTITPKNITGFHDLWLDGGTNIAFSGGTSTPATIGINHWPFVYSSVQNVQFTGFSTGLFISSTNSIATRPNAALYTGNVLSNCYAAIKLDDSNKAEYIGIENNNILQCFYGIWNQTAANILVSGNVMRDLNTALYSQTPATARGHTLYTGNIINHAGRAIFVNGIMNTRWINNEMLGGTAILLFSATNCVLSDNHFELNGTGFWTIGGSSNYMSRNLVIGTTAPVFTGDGVTNSNVILSGNVYAGYGPVFSGLSGTGTVATTNTSVAITHGLAATPTTKQLLITPTSGLGSAASYWISAVTSTNFTVTVNAAPTSADFTFAWRHVEQSQP